MSATVTVAVKAETDHLIRFARIIEKHFGALADDLEQLRDSDDAEKRKAVNEPAKDAEATPGHDPRSTTTTSAERRWSPTADVPASPFGFTR